MLVAAFARAFRGFFEGFARELRGFRIHYTLDQGYLNGHFTRASLPKHIVIGLTAVGRATIVRLRMNRDVVVKSRRRWVVAGWHPPSETV